MKDAEAMRKIKQILSEVDAGMITAFEYDIRPFGERSISVSYLIKQDKETNLPDFPVEPIGSDW